MPAPTRLGNLINGTTPAPTSGATKMQAALSGARVLEAVELPGLGVLAMLTLVGSERFLDIEGDAFAAMERRKLTENAWNEHKFELERAVRVLAEAVREHDPIAKAEGRVPAPFGTVAEWGQVAPSIVNAVWSLYSELVERFDPLAERIDISPLEMMEIRAAIEKKSAASLRSFGLQKLCAYLLTTGDRRASSPTLSASFGLESQDSYAPSPTTSAAQSDT